MDYALLERRQEEEGLVEFRYGDQAFTYDLRMVARALWRVNEVATVSRADAQELSDCFNDSEAVLHQVINRAAAALDAAEYATKTEKARLLLDVVPGEMERLGKDSQDRRDAVIQRHPDYLAALAQERHMRWVVMDLRAKKERVHRANSTALAVLGERPNFHRGSTSGGSPQTGTFGSAKY